MAAEQSPGGEGAPFEGTMHAQGINGVIGASGIVSAMAVTAIHQGYRGQNEYRI